MGTLFEKLKYTKDSVNDIQAAIIEKGIPVVDTVPLDDYGNKIREIQTGKLNVNVFNIQQEGNTITYLHKNGLTGIISRNGSSKYLCIIKGSQMIYDFESTVNMSMYFISKGILVITNGMIIVFTNNDIIKTYYDENIKYEFICMPNDTLYAIQDNPTKSKLKLIIYDLFNYSGSPSIGLKQTVFEQGGLADYKYVVVKNVLYIIINSIATPTSSTIFKFNKAIYDASVIKDPLTNPIIFKYNSSEYIVSDMNIYRYDNKSSEWITLNSNLTTLREIYVCNNYIILSSLEGLHIYNTDSHKNLIVIGYNDLTPLYDYRVWDTSNKSTISDIIKDDTVPMFSVKHEVTPNVFKIKLAYIRLYLDDIILDYISDTTEIIHNIRFYVNIKNKSLTFIDTNASYVWFNGIYGVEYNLVLPKHATSLTRNTVGNYHILKLTNEDSSITIVIINILTGKNNIISDIVTGSEYQFFDYSEFDHVVLQISNKVCIINNITNSITIATTNTISHALEFASRNGIYFRQDNNSMVSCYNFKTKTIVDEGSTTIVFSLDSILERVYINSELIGYVIVDIDDNLYYVSANAGIASLYINGLSRLGRYVDGVYKSIISEKHLSIVCTKNDIVHTYVLPYDDYIHWNTTLLTNGLLSHDIKSITDDTSNTFMSIGIDDKKQEVVYIKSNIDYTKPISLISSGLYVFPKNNKVRLLNNLIVNDYTAVDKLDSSLRWNESDVIEIKKINPIEPVIKLESIGKGVFIKNLILATGYIYNMDFSIKKAIPNNNWSVIDKGSILTDKSFTIIINDIEPRTENKILEY